VFPPTAKSTVQKTQWCSALLRWIIACLLAAPAAVQAHTVLVLGDSISAAYGIPRERGWVALLQQKLPDSKVINASISGDTTDGGVARLPTLLQKQRPDIVIIELGGNDGLRGFQIQRIRDNLARMVQLSQDAGARVLLVGMKIPPNYGLRYTSEFYESYTLTAQKFDIPLVPFILQDIATDPEMMQDDRIHPRAEGQQKLLDNVWPHLKALLLSTK
jgi:acyl-CoA thioesterase I